MGLDVALGVVILFTAIRGWLQGFLYQAIRLGGLLACVYLAAPVRDQAKPHVAAYLPSIKPDLVDRLLWWVAASVTYIVIVGVATLVLKMTKRPEVPGMPPQRSRNDQFAGFLLGIAKGGLIGAFLVAALDVYGMKQIESIPWAEKQAKGSMALKWNGQYHPAARIWESAPVRHLVNHIHRMGLDGPSETVPTDANGKAGDRPIVQTASKGRSEASRKGVAQGEAPADPPAPAASPSKGKVAAARPESSLDDLKDALDAASRPK